MSSLKCLTSSTSFLTRAILILEECRAFWASGSYACTVNHIYCAGAVRKVFVLSDTPNIRHRAGSLHTFTYKYSHTYIVHLWLTNPWRTNLWPTNSRSKNPWPADNTILWRMAYVIHKLRNIEIPEKKKRV